MRIEKPLPLRAELWPIFWLVLSHHQNYSGWSEIGVYFQRSRSFKVRFVGNFNHLHIWGWSLCVAHPPGHRFCRQTHAIIRLRDWNFLALGFFVIMRRIERTAKPWWKYMSEDKPYSWHTGANNGNITFENTPVNGRSIVIWTKRQLSELNGR